MWEPQRLEEILRDRLTEELGSAAGDERYSDYVAARRNLVEDILPEIKGQVPDLTDHGPVHIADVLSNVYKLLGEGIRSLTATELYVLCVSVLFHDVGNLFGRSKHNRNISAIYEAVRRGDDRFRNEKAAVMAIAGAHTGCATDGSVDTIKDVGDVLPIHQTTVRATQLAAVLRLADELAEGPQRTSAFMQNHHKYSVDSMIYHSYASMTELCIDRGGGRVAVTYNIPIKLSGCSLMAGPSEISLEEMLKFTYKRILKLDQERKYTKHYCEWLNQFRTTSATYRFWLNGDQIAASLEPLVISDLVVPGEVTKAIEELAPAYDLKILLDRLQKEASDLMGASHP